MKFSFSLLWANALLFLTGGINRKDALVFQQPVRG